MFITFLLLSSFLYFIDKGARLPLSWAWWVNQLRISDQSVCRPDCLNCLWGGLAAATQPSVLVKQITVCFRDLSHLSLIVIAVEAPLNADLKAVAVSLFQTVSAPLSVNLWQCLNLLLTLFLLLPSFNDCLSWPKLCMSAPCFATYYLSL